MIPIRARIILLGKLARSQATLGQSWKKKAAGEAVTAHALLTDLKACSVGRDLEWGRRIHARAVESGNAKNMYVETALIKMYAKCGSMPDARRVFDGIQKPDVVSWTALLLGYAENGQGRVALDLFNRMKARGCAPNSVTYVAALKACTSLTVGADAGGKSGCLERGRQMHLEAGGHLNHYVQNTLIDMYAKCGSMIDARRVFEENGDGRVALDLFNSMKARGCAPDSVTYVVALKACISLAESVGVSGRAECLERGRVIHLEIGCHFNRYVQNTLISMYAKCGEMPDARRVFDSMQRPDVVSWTALLLGYAENGEGRVALDLFSNMKARGVLFDSVIYVAAIKACTSLAMNGDDRDGLHRGRDIHSKIGNHLNPCLRNMLIDMYAKCNSMSEARQVFDSLQDPDVVSWNTLLLGYAERGDGVTALDLFSRMKARGCLPNSVTYMAALKACASLAVQGDVSRKGDCLERGRQIHSEAGCHLDHYVQNTLIDMYAKCGSMVDSRLVFDLMLKPDVVSWNALLLGYVDNGQGLDTLELFSRMKASRCVPNSLTYIAALKACTSLAVDRFGSGKEDWLERGREIHSEISCQLSNHLQNSLIDMYTKCGSMVDARRVFDSIQKPDVVSWSALLMGYAENGEGSVALDFFSRMKANGCAPNSVTYVAALKACTSLAADGDDIGKADCLRRGREIHSEIGCHLNQYVQNTLIDMYANCGSMEDARRVFDSIQEPDVVSWSALVMGYTENGDGSAALELFSRMKASGCAADSVTHIAALKACGSIGDLALGREIHSEISNFPAHVVTCLVDFYAKCGSMADAREVFDLHPRARDTSTWNALLAGYASFGNTASAFDLFESMQDAGFRPDSVTFVCMLLCCSHAGLVEKAREYIEAMPVRYGVTPCVMHYNCMVDLLGRANKLTEAVAMLQRMPCTDAVTWRALLGACRKWKNVEIGRWAFQSLVDFDKRDASAYVLMANMYGSRGMWEEQDQVWGMRRQG